MFKYNPKAKYEPNGGNVTFKFYQAKIFINKL